MGVVLEVFHSEKLIDATLKIFESCKICGQMETGTMSYPNEVFLNETAIVMLVIRGS